MRTSIKHFLILMLVFAPVAIAVADIGETFDLKQKRDRLQSEWQHLKNDSTALPEQIVALSDRIILLDQQIFESYDGTVDRISSNGSGSSNNGRELIWLALITTLISIFFTILLAMARGRIIDNGGVGLLDIYRKLSLDFFQKVSPEKAGSQRMLRINVVVVIGMVFMGVSVLGYLISKF